MAGAFLYRPVCVCVSISTLNEASTYELKTYFLTILWVIQVKGNLQDYYQRKPGEGKHTMLGLSAVCNKLIHRVCAVVRRGKKHGKNIRSPLHNP